MKVLVIEIRRHPSLLPWRGEVLREMVPHKVTQDAARVVGALHCENQARQERANAADLLRGASGSPQLPAKSPIEPSREAQRRTFAIEVPRFQFRAECLLA